MKRVTIAGRCLACWTLQWVDVEIETHLPPAFRSVCRGCRVEQLHAVTGQLVPTLRRAALQELKAAHREKRAPRWAELPLVLDLTGRSLDAEIERDRDPLAGAE